ncbi:Poly(A) polymerase PAPa [Cyphellophora attinorum]|uniref:Poly(A) polymerase n=1 Tax=Cyphellophora attinorum TaxID=1664694 RepID=A0A0N1H0L4_9EURO|nr:Poly(A) polymerase PAPa [Phialophora attinorum]KPI37450.1 Poly(A) polymerase PAPa [Phialophora attinorum]
MATTTKQYGITPPMSVALPEQKDIEKNAELIEELKRENNYETQEATKKRMSTLALLQRCLIEFVKHVALGKQHSPQQVEKYGGKIVAYGSYRLGVYGPGSDIDTLAVAPRHITRDDFFKHFPDTLRRLVTEDAIGFLVPVHDAFVPIIKLQLYGIEIDLIFASINGLESVDKTLNLSDNKLLDGMDQATVRAVTGPRVTDEILRLVPEAKTFRTALRAIKLWAQRRAIYANIVGFPGGVAWAMLVARVCQFYPHAIGATIVSKFFFIMKDWKWPQPVLLKDIEPQKGNDKVWNPALYNGDRKNLMPIITPAYPSMCATYNISQSNKTVILRELERGAKITNNIFFGAGKWSDLFEKHTFFTKDHKYYLSVIASCKGKDDIKAWSGLVESKIRILVGQLELIKDQISLARPYVKGFARAHRCADEANGNAVGASGAEEPPSGGNFHTHTFYIGIDLTPSAQKNLNISAAISYFKGVCQGWQDYDANIHFLDAVPVRAHELPDDLFDKAKGEVKPARPPKKKPLARPNGDANGASTGPDAKRPNDDSNGVSAGPDTKRQKTANGTTTPTPAATVTIAPA